MAKLPHHGLKKQQATRRSVATIGAATGRRGRFAPTAHSRKVSQGADSASLKWFTAISEPDSENFTLLSQQNANACLPLGLGAAVAQPSACHNVRFGSLADITARSRHVRFTPDSGHSSVQVGCPRLRRYLSVMDLCSHNAVGFTRSADLLASSL